MSVEDLLQSATELHRAGRFDEARARYQQLLSREPRHAPALNLLGVLYGQSGDWVAARRSLEAAIAVDPSRGEYFANLAEAHRNLDQVRESAVAYRRAIELAPNAAALPFGLGTLLQQAGELDEAARSFEASLRVDPNSAAAHCRLADVLQLRGDHSRAINHYREALRLRGDYVEALVNLGNALREAHQPEAALPLLERAVQLHPELAAAHNNLGNVLQDLARLPAAQRAYERAIELLPSVSEFHFNLGSVLRDQGDWQAALAHCDEALRLAPSSAQAQYRRGTVLLALGRFAEGWPAYEARIRCPQFQIPTFAAPRWQGEPLAGRSLLVHAEQGLGDTLQFVRYVRKLEVDLGRVVLAVPRSLIPLLAASGYPGLVPLDGPLPPFDCQVPLLSLPGVFHTDLASIPDEVPYLAAEPARVERWHRELAPYRGLRVGIVWQGRPTYRGDRLRSIPLTNFEPLAAAGATLFSLQKGPGSDQLADLGGRFEVVDLEMQLDRDAAFVDTAAVMKSLDLVITSDTAAAHLAGGLAVPVWVALGLAPEWRWLASGEHSPWYPTMRLFRQTRVNDWSDVFARMAGELAALPPRDRA